LDAMAGNGGDQVARQDLYVIVLIAKRAVGADLQRIEETRVNEGIAGIELEGRRSEPGLGLDALPSCRADILEIAESLQLRDGNGQDVIGVGGAETAELPFERPDVH